MFQTVSNKFPIPPAFRRAFVVTLIFVISAFALFWLDFFRGYRAEMTVLVISKTEASSQEVAENAAELMRTLSFYNRVLADNDFIDDDFEGYSQDKRKALWNDAISIERKLGSGALVLQAKDDTPEKARRLVKQTAQTLFAVMGLYYNVKTDIDMRVIDGPIVAYVLQRPFFFGMTSVLSGLFVTLLFFGFLSAVSGFFTRQKGNFSRVGDSDITATKKQAPLQFSTGAAVPWIDPRKFVPAKPETLSFEKDSSAKAEVPLAQTSQYVAHASAPVNLPVASDETLVSPVPDSIDKPVLPDVKYSEPTSEEYKHRLNDLLEQSEPTSEEYKRRLNDLLSGL